MPCIPYFICLFNVYPFQCQPSPPPSGAIKFGDTADNCTQSIAGTVRYSTSQNALELCNGNAWLLLVTGEFYVFFFYHTHVHQSNIVDSLFSRDGLKIEHFYNPSFHTTPHQDGREKAVMSLEENDSEHLTC